MMKPPKKVAITDILGAKRSTKVVASRPPEQSPTATPVPVLIFWTIDEDYPVVTNPTIPEQSNPHVALIKAFIQNGV